MSALIPMTISLIVIFALARATEAGRLHQQLESQRGPADRDEQRIALNNQFESPGVRNTHHMQHDAPLGLR